MIEVYSLNPFTWYNVLYFAFAGLALLYYGFLIMTGGAHADGDADFHADGDFHTDVDGHFDAHADVHADGHFDHHIEGDAHHGDHDTHHDSDYHADHGGILGILNLRNRCPKVYGITLLFLIWGLLGYTYNKFFLTNFVITQIASFFVGLAISGFFAIMIVRIVAPIIGKYMPSDKSFDGFGSNITNFIGRTAKVSTFLYPDKFGAVIISNTTIQVYAKLIQYEGEGLKRDEEVLLINKDDNDYYTCIPVKKELIKI